MGGSTYRILGSSPKRVGEFWAFRRFLVECGYARHVVSARMPESRARRARGAPEGVAQARAAGGVRENANVSNPSLA